MKEGGRLSVLMPLGNGFDTEKSGPAPLIIGGGAGIPPLYGLCKALAGEKKISGFCWALTRQMRSFTRRNLKNWERVLLLSLSTALWEKGDL